MSDLPTPNSPTPGTTTTPVVQQQNDQGQGSVRVGPAAYDPKVKLDEWGPDRSGGSTTSPDRTPFA